MKHALITGATMGRGLELSKLFAADGYHIIAVARHQQDLEQTKRDPENKYRIKVHTITAELFHPDKAIMANMDMVISGFNNKIQVAKGAITPDAKAAEQMAKQQEPKEGSRPQGSN